jgi:hypothetical protein
MKVSGECSAKRSRLVRSAILNPFEKQEIKVAP